MEANASGMPLFAAWRTATDATWLDQPDVTDGGRAALLLHLLRHHRAGAHLIAIRAAGLSPLEAIVAGADGEAGAIAFGWQQPYPPAAPLLRRWIWAEAVTDRLVGESMRALGPAERCEFIDLLDEAMDAAQLPTGELPQVRVGTARRLQG
jgi:hypothetical protein